MLHFALVYRINLFRVKNHWNFSKNDWTFMTYPIQIYDQLIMFKIALILTFVFSVNRLFRLQVPHALLPLDLKFA